jgi:hypothetical protein
MNPNPIRELLLQAYDGWNVPNRIDPDPNPGYLALARQGIPADILRLRITLGPPTGRYNCHGLVFASRRTNIPPVGIVVDIDLLLQRDQYRQVASPKIGDIIVYREGTEIVHTGIVIRLEPVGSMIVPMVWSKWAALEECVHAERACPYRGTTEYWRLRDVATGRIVS